MSFAISMKLDIFLANVFVYSCSNFVFKFIQEKLTWTFPIFGGFCSHQIMRRKKLTKRAEFTRWFIRLFFAIKCAQEFFFVILLLRFQLFRPFSASRIRLRYNHNEYSRHPTFSVSKSMLNLFGIVDSSHDEHVASSKTNYAHIPMMNETSRWDT